MVYDIMEPGRYMMSWGRQVYGVMDAAKCMVSWNLKCV